jgi:flagellar biosynthesis/type III secretory pathway protein FliH
MSFWTWDTGAGLGLGSTRRVLSASELPFFAKAQAMAEHMAQRLQHSQQAFAGAEAAAREAGHAQGLSEGRAEAAAACARRLLELEQAAREHQQQRDQDVARLALAVVHKLLGEWPEPARLAAAAANAAAGLAPARVLRVRLHPERLEATRAQASVATAPWLQQAEWVADATLAHDACRLETEFGAVDAGPTEQLARLAAAWSVPPT